MGARTLIDLGAAMTKVEKREVVACIWDMVSDGILAYDMSATVSLRSNDRPKEPRLPSLGMIKGMEGIRRSSSSISAKHDGPQLPPTIGPASVEWLRQQRHPAHRASDEYGNPAKPLEPTDLLLRWRMRRTCRQRGGHWWHSLDGMGEWFCCGCGKTRDGWPKDGR